MDLAGEVWIEGVGEGGFPGFSIASGFPSSADI